MQISTAKVLGFLAAAIITVLAAVRFVHHGNYGFDLYDHFWKVFFNLLWLNAVIAILPYLAARRWVKAKSFKMLFGSSVLLLYYLFFFCVFNVSHLKIIAGGAREVYDFFF